MQKSDFYFDLPKELIAQEPCEPRDAARLLCLGRASGELRHAVFRDLPGLLQPGDLLVVNNSKVLPARLIGHKEGTGAVCELLLLRQVKGDVWECLAKPGKRLHAGTRIIFGDGTLTAVVRDTMEDGNKHAEFFTILRRCMKNWTPSGKCLCRPISKSSWTTNPSIRLYMRKSLEALLRPRQACISHRSLWIHCEKKASALPR